MLCDVRVSLPTSSAQPACCCCCPPVQCCDPLLTLDTLCFTAAASFALALQLAELMKAGKLKVTIHEVLPLAEAAKAHEISETGRVRGKLVLQVAKE